MTFSEFLFPLRGDTGNEDLLCSQKSSQVLLVSAQGPSLYFTIKTDVHNFEILSHFPRTLFIYFLANEAEVGRLDILVEGLVGWLG